ncbi:MAG: MYG1 family protein [Candidatus Saccharibacteria bacterium]|nr:MYG1 family protein [Candidatus Saccharibacteria bacterium]
MKINKIIVHGGIFHTDDVLCVALARIANPLVEISRVLEAPTKIEDGVIVADIGLGKYDHHQADAEIRPTGEKYAACGLLLRDIWEDIFPSEGHYLAFERNFIMPIEKQDNGGDKNPLSLAINGFVPARDDDADMDEAFLEAVSFMETIVRRQVERAKSAIRADGLVTAALAEAGDEQIVILPQFAPWQSVLVPSDKSFVIFPSNRGEVNLQTIPVSAEKRVARVPLPESWLEKKPAGCNFVHPGLYMAAFDTIESAISAARSI